MYVLSAVYIIFFILVYHFVSCDFHCSALALRFVCVCACPARVIKKQPPLRHIKVFPGIKNFTSAQTGSHSNPNPTQQPSIHPSNCLPSRPFIQPVSYPSRLWHFVLMLE